MVRPGPRHREGRDVGPGRPRKHGLTVAEIEEWRDRFLLAAENALRARPKDEEALKGEQIKRPKEKIGELVLDLAILKEATKDGLLHVPCRTGKGNGKEISMKDEKGRKGRDCARIMSAAAIAASVPSAAFAAGPSADHDLVIAGGHVVDPETGLIGTALGRRLRHLARRRHVRRGRRTTG